MMGDLPDFHIPHAEKIEPLKLSAMLSTSNDLLEQRLLATDRWLADSGVTAGA